MRETIKQSLAMYLLLTLVCGVVYPSLITAIAQCAWHDKANGSLIVDEKSGKVIGSELLGQEFLSDRYFWGRLSATTPAYNAAASSGSNLGASNPALAKQMKARIENLQKGSRNSGSIPVDLVTASGSGLDPDISIASAEFQAKRVAQTRGISQEELGALISANTTKRQFGCLGEARVNVVTLNIALDRLAESKKTSTE